MSTLNYASLSDIDLVLKLRNGAPNDEQVAALDQLSMRCGPAFQAVRKQIVDLPSFLHQAGAGAIEEIEGDAMAKAIKTYQSSRNVKFSSYAGTVLNNSIIDIFRRPKVTVPLTEEGTREVAAVIEERLDHDVLRQAADLTRACLAKLEGRKQEVFIWSALFKVTPTALHELMPDVSLDNFKQIKSRANAEFVREWQAAGGEQLLRMVQEVGQAMAERTDLSKIKDGKARRALEVWREGKSVSAVVSELKLKEAEARQLLLDGLREMARQALLRGGQAADLADYLELAEDGHVRDEITLEVERTLALVRAAFGLGPLEAAVDTLGSFLQRRLKGTEAYSRACREMGLKPAELRRLLADEGEVDVPLLDKLSALLNIPRERLEALPRKPAEEARPLRSSERYDSERFRARVWACLKRS